MRNIFKKAIAPFKNGHFYIVGLLGGAIGVLLVSLLPGLPAYGGKELISGVLIGSLGFAYIQCLIYPKKHQE